MKATHYKRTLAIFLTLIVVGGLLIWLADQPELGGLLITSALAQLGISPMEVRDQNKNGIADGHTNPPPPRDEEE